jgi:hypothetical protein
MALLSSNPLAAIKYKYPGINIKRNEITQPFSAFCIIVEIREGISKWLTDLEGGQQNEIS